MHIVPKWKVEKCFNFFFIRRSLDDWMFSAERKTQKESAVYKIQWIEMRHDVVNDSNLMPWRKVSFAIHSIIICFRFQLLFFMTADPLYTKRRKKEKKKKKKNFFSYFLTVRHPHLIRSSIPWSAFVARFNLDCIFWLWQEKKTKNSTIFGWLWLCQMFATRIICCRVFFICRILHLYVVHIHTSESQSSSYSMTDDNCHSHLYERQTIKCETKCRQKVRKMKRDTMNRKSKRRKITNNNVEMLMFIRTQFQSVNVCALRGLKLSAFRLFVNRMKKYRNREK